MAFYSYLAESPDLTLDSFPEVFDLPDLHSPDEILAFVPDLAASSDETPNLKKPKKRSELCVLCHNCRQWKLEHVVCSGESCSLKFCSSCLLNRHGESIEAEQAENVRWVCPRCRGGCGQGCENCCHCGPCRKIRGLEPTGKITVKIARENGFTNVHDYMVHLETKESPAAIARRKRGRGWTSIDAPVTMGGKAAATSKRKKGQGLTSIDAPATTGGKAAVIQHEENVRWGKKKPRTARFALATPKWGSGAREEDLFDARIVLRSLGSNWEVGRKLIPSTPDSQTEKKSPDSTRETEQSPNTESTRETRESSSSESSFIIPDSEVLAVSWAATKRLLNAWKIDENEESL